MFSGAYPRLPAYGLASLFGARTYSLAFGTAPANGFVGVALDAFTITGAVPGSTVTVTPATGAATSGNTATANASGVATFSALVLDTYAAAQTLTASSPGAVAVESDAFETWWVSAIANLAQWLRADAGITERESGGEIFVTAWADQSGVGNDVAQGTAANQPKLISAGLNGRNYLQFSGTQWLSGNYVSALTRPITAYVVARATAAGTFLGGAPNDPIRFVLDWLSGSGTWRMYSGVNLLGSVADPNWHYFGSLFNGASSTLRVDGAQQAAGDAGSNNNYSVSVLGAINASGGAPLSGGIAELVFVDASIGAGDRTKLESYLSAKYGV